MNYKTMQQPYTFIGFDGDTGSMQPAYQDARGVVYDGFLYPVNYEDLREFVENLFDKPEGVEISLNFEAQKLASDERKAMNESASQRLWGGNQESLSHAQHEYNNAQGGAELAYWAEQIALLPELAGPSIVILTVIIFS